MEATVKRASSSPSALLNFVLPATPLWAYVIAVAPAATLYALLYAQPWVPMSNLIRDPAAILNGRFYDGFVSNVGVLLWCAAAAICLFRGCESWVRRGEAGVARFLLSAGALTSILLLDDLFMAHEQILPDVFGIPEKAILAAYPLLLCAHLFVNRRPIVQADAPILLLSLGFFGVSTVFDVVVPYHFYETAAGLEVNRGVILEEAFKFLGISAWTVFHVRAAWRAGGALEHGAAQAVQSTLDTPTPRLPSRHSAIVRAP